ncbi:MAG: SGNH/GDSL hydrolase family protein, partial [Nitrospinales bacterium]
MSSVKRFTFILLTIFLTMLMLLVCGETILYVTSDHKLMEFREEMRQKKMKAEFNLKKETDEAFEQNSKIIQSVYTFHPFYGYTNKNHIENVPGYNYSIDAYGYRKDFDFRDRKKDIFQIGLFGGSAAFGYQMDDEDTLSHLLGDLLKNKYGDKIRVKNFGVQGWHLPQQLFAFIRERQYLNAVIFFDGVNELDLYVQETNSNYPSDFPYFDARILFQTDKNSTIAKEIERLYSAQASFPVDFWWSRSRLFLFFSKRYFNKLEADTTLRIRKT